MRGNADMTYREIDRDRIEDENGRVFVRQLELVHSVWFADLEESDDNASTIQCFRWDDGSLMPVADNIHATYGLLNALEELAERGLTPVYLSDEAREYVNGLEA